MFFGTSLTLGLQLGQDGLGPTDGCCCEGLHAFLCRITDSLDMGVALLGGGVGCRYHAAGGADEGHVGHSVHHAGLQGEAAEAGWAGGGEAGGQGPKLRCLCFCSRLWPGKWLSSPLLWVHRIVQPRNFRVPPCASFVLALQLICLDVTLTPTTCQGLVRDENSTLTRFTV